MDDATFDYISKQISIVTEQYHSGQIKFFVYTEKYDNIFLNNKIDKKAYRLEISKRILRKKSGK